ncbi:hypothetical protein ASE73_09925 [Sphingomonas sp. Leaf24]|uniref:hypothetical protein n=1 Tax=unclassified Sphingomonas TaxID=196159 RepID=UPI0006F48AA3|nr:MULTISPECIES: hypothetical protein [unclassified Sphingomonas]KQM14485.1 hypothetical protein ASE50_07975 [Sphingomonas sp. Leaf5]KQM87786.1 hypothetical protein ASE73_09925 [Sphingomonas sp. Leaf24]
MRIKFLAPAFLLAGCVPPGAPPEPVTAPSPAPRPAAVAPTAPPVSDWRDLPRTPGDWQYRGLGTGSAATYGVRGAAPVATLTCNRAAKQVTMVLATPRPAAGTVTIRTTSTQRSVAVQPMAGGVGMALPASDRLLDAIGFSRGRFVVEGAGIGRLVLPSWAEILRVTEDCRG